MDNKGVRTTITMTYQQGERLQDRRNDHDDGERDDGGLVLPFPLLLPLELFSAVMAIHLLGRYFGKKRSQNGIRSSFLDLFFLSSINSIRLKLLHPLGGVGIPSSLKICFIAYVNTCTNLGI